jgi:hypothetical protein
MEVWFCIHINFPNLDERKIDLFNDYLRVALKMLDIFFEKNKLIEIKLD